jgi:hypothetical protein
MEDDRVRNFERSKSRLRMGGINYLKWLLIQSVAPKTKIESVVTDDAFATLSEKLTTPLQFEYYLTRALEEA